MPKSHYKIWLQWGLPGVPPSNPDRPNHYDKYNVKYKYQLDIMNNMTVEIRRKTLEHIQQRAAPASWHPDSITGITSSGVQHDMAFESELGTIIEGVEEISIGMSLQPLFHCSEELSRILPNLTILLGRKSPITPMATVQQVGNQEVSSSSSFVLSSSSKSPSTSPEPTYDSDTSDDSDMEGGAVLEPAFGLGMQNSKI
jgi:hypothetical protein